MEHPSAVYERGLVVYNPTKSGSPRFKRAERQIDYLARQQQLRLESLPTEASRETTQNTLLKTLKPSDLLMVIGGDGTINMTIGALLRVEREKRATLLPAAAGTANDFSRSHNGKLITTRALSHIFETGSQVDVRPLQVTIHDELAGSLQSYLAANNAGFNYTANAAHMLDQPAHRNGALRRIPVVGGLAQEVSTVLASTKHLKTFSLYENDGQDVLHLLDRTLVHARTASKYGHFAISHTDHEFLDIATERPTRAALIGAAARMLVGRSPAERQTEIAFRIGPEDILGHVDGEVYPIAAHSMVTAQLADEAFTTYSLRAV